MSEAAKTGSAQAEWMRRLAAARGLGRAFAMYPETVTAAFVRASQCMSTLPANMPPVTEPAPRFDPAMSPATEPMPRFDPAAVTVHRDVPVDPGPAREWTSPLL